MTKHFSIFVLLVLISLASCEKKTPIIPNEEELITTLKFILTPVGGGSDIVFSFVDIDGDGGQEPIITNANLTANTVYNGRLELWNESILPKENITLEIEEESESHQFFYEQKQAALLIDYLDVDTKGNPLGVFTLIETQASASDTLTITLRHLPKKPNNMTLLDAGGETDIAVNFIINVL